MQLGGVAVTAWELTHRASHTQVEKLHAPGVNTRLGVAVNQGGDRERDRQVAGADRVDRRRRHAYRR
jgi:hypothetical protein